MRIGSYLIVAFFAYGCQCEFYNLSKTYNEICNSPFTGPVYATDKRNVTDVFELWTKFPLDLFSNSEAISPQCRNEHENYVAKLTEGELDALRMYDATAKLPSGLLRGNVNQYGDFDECLEVDQAQYCLAEIDIDPLWRKSQLSKYKDLLHSHFNIKETFDDPGHRIPGFTLVRWGFCIPKGCSDTDLTVSLKEKLSVNSRVRPTMCQTSQSGSRLLTVGDYAAWVYFGALALCIASATVFETKLMTVGGKWALILASFSLRKNYRQLTTVVGKSDEYKSVHGARFLAALALLMAHKTMALLYNPYVNRTRMAESHAMKWSVIGRNAIIFTDVFLLLSGLLNANVLFAELDKGRRSMRFGRKIISRLFRILPSLISVILFCTYLLPSMGSGPLWPLVVTHHSTLCKKYMWRNMLLVHNYFGFENMCLTHTHQVGIDTQLFLATPLFVYSIWRCRTSGFRILAFVAVSSTALRFWATVTYDLSHFVHFGIPISRMFDTANYSYILPTHRATIYLMGVTLAYVLRYTSKNPALSKAQTATIWAVLYLVSFGTWFGPVNMSVRGYEYNKLQAALYGALSPITWGVGVAWVIYTTERGFGSWFAHILNWKYFEVFTRIAYAVYLVQFPVFFYNVGITKHVDEYKSYMMLPPLETGAVLIISTLLTLFVEMPFQNVGRILISDKK